jgi:hypothetical protein
MHYFRESRAATAGLHLFLRTPAAGWPAFAESTPPDVDLIMELPPRRDVFEGIRQWLLDTERRNRCYLQPPSGLEPDYIQSIRRLTETVYGVELLPPEGEGRKNV